MGLENLTLVLSRPRFPENIGMTARACANMGCNSLYLVSPENWDFGKAALTATPRGTEILKNVKVFSSLHDALAEIQISWAATARKGGWRREMQIPETAAAEISELLQAGVKVALVMGNEKSGLSNTEIQNCSKLVHIPTFGELSSLNLAQASLLLLYECARMVKKLHEPSLSGISCANLVSSGDFQLLEKNLKEILVALHCVQGKNPDYHFIQWHNILSRMNLRRHEFDAWMGLCRQIRLLLNEKRK